MKDRICASCGKASEGLASIYRDGKEFWYCHANEGPSCYIAASNRDYIDDELVKGYPGGPINGLVFRVSKEMWDGLNREDGDA